MTKDTYFVWRDIVLGIFWGLFILLFLISAVWGMNALFYEYQVWSAGKEGQALLKKAEWTRQITVKEALAKKDSAVMLAQAEIERAKGIAQANQIIGDSLKGNESYLKYLWIDNLHNTRNQIIYVPTEASLPILEASRAK